MPITIEVKRRWRTVRIECAGYFAGARPAVRCAMQSSSAGKKSA